MTPDEIKLNLKAIGGCVNFEALEYINELEAEVERLEHLTDTKSIMIKELNKACENIKNKAIKEFAEKLKGTFPKDDFLRSTKRISEDIDNLVKEMAGEIK